MDDDISEIELIICNADRVIFDVAANRQYLNAIAKTQILILKEMRLQKK